VNTHTFFIKDKNVAPFIGDLHRRGIRTYQVSNWNIVGRTYLIAMEDDDAIILKLKYS
jgi:hypothetical protein